jgi:HEPN domain-containing protein
MNNTKERIEYWLDIADYDLITAEAMLQSKRYLYLGFMCHQVIEKSIKAYFWYSNKTEPPYTHNLLMLSEKANIENLLTDQQRKLIDELMPLNIQTRYPEDKQSLLKYLN